MLASTPTSVQGRNVYSNDSHLWDCLEGGSGNAGFDGTDNMVKSIANGTRDNKWDTSPLVVTRLQYSNNQFCEWRRA